MPTAVDNAQSAAIFKQRAGEATNIELWAYAQQQA
jgi:hypothetical protein